MSATTSFTRSMELTTAAFLKHIQDLSKDYSLVMFVNLMQKSKPHEHMLTQAMEEQFVTHQLKNARYIYYDFHTECRGDVNLMI